MLCTSVLCFQGGMLCTSVLCFQGGMLCTSVLCVSKEECCALVCCVSARSHALSVILSLLYGKMLVILGLAFPVAQFISRDIPATYFEGFYLFLYFGYMAFLLCLYGPVLKQKAVDSVIHGGKEHSDNSRNLEVPVSHNVSQSGRKRSRYGSFYLRMGAVVFGIGSMIYSVLEFGQYFDMKEDEKCHNALIALTPAVRVVFIITQLQFIFYTSKQLAVKKFKSLARFGLMHMMATNICEWFNVLVQESKYELLRFHDMGSKTSSSKGSGVSALSDAHSKNLSLDLSHQPNNNMKVNLHRAARGLMVEELYECRSANIMGSLVQDASPFLFPSTIEYSLICAVILYTMWKDSCSLRAGPGGGGGSYGNQVANAKVSPVPSKTNAANHVRVDCANAHRGLFAGILVLVLTIISLIMFFVLIKEPGYDQLAVFEVNVTTLALYVVNMLAILLCAYRMKELSRYDTNRYFELDNTLLVVAQLGLYASNISSLIAGYFSKSTRSDILIKSVTSIVQATLQTVFIVDSWWRICTTPSKLFLFSSIKDEIAYCSILQLLASCYLARARVCVCVCVLNSLVAVVVLGQMRRRPGRQLITFLLATNLALWLVTRTQNARPEFQPVEVEFYGVWAWTVITNVSMPLAIFYRFHSAVCLCEIWKCTYKMKLVPSR
ncbi:hypothetical protein PR048_027534 [Dryococelus australis]|uniref:Otopetrin-2 n=1 Tax=Dryococelus australis TaxID=614101 RepID=A0ABQ9GGT0_9NEOP|nr:hypothetical protein PR048_027534 [Dryococelus australis]